MAISKQVLDELLGDRDPNEVFSKDGLLDDLKKALAERILNSELDEHLENEHGSGKRNRRNGTSPKTVQTESSKVPQAPPSP